MKKIVSALLLLLIPTIFAFSDNYQISNVEYEITGKTRKYALEKKVEINKHRIFNNEDDLMNYIEDFKKQLENTRNFETVAIDFKLEKKEKSEIETNTETDNGTTANTISENEEIDNLTDDDKKTDETEVVKKQEDFYLVHLTVKTKDTMHFIGTPYPKYDSNSGFLLKLKLKDTNFLGSLEEMSSDINFALEQKDENEDPKAKLGFNLSFDTPFKAGIFNANFVNDLSFSYTFGESTPEWNLKSGVKFSKPFENFSIDFEFFQSFARDLDYEEKDVNGTKVHYGDGTYFTEDFKFSVPLVLQDISSWGKIYYAPYVAATYNWDFDGIDSNNKDLAGPAFSIGQKLYTSRINWEENFRTGIDASLTEDLCYNIQKETISPSVIGEIKAYKAFKYAGLCTDIYGFACLHGEKSFGGRLRGVRDDAYYESDDQEIKMTKECESSGAIVINIDIPIKLFRAYWDKIPVIKKIPFVRYFNMEVQISPFTDIALCHNRAEDTFFSIWDMFWTGGLEMLVYPLKWRGIQVRASLGIDLAQKMPFIKEKLHQEWRDSKWYEISIGIGLAY